MTRAPRPTPTGSCSSRTARSSTRCSNHRPTASWTASSTWGADVFKLTLRGLVAHKLRFLLTGVAVILGVAFVSGTLVFTDTVKKTFDSLFASVYDGTDAYVRSASTVKGQFGPAERGRIPETLVPTVQSVQGAAAAEGQIQIRRAQYLDRQGKGIGDPGQGAPTLGFNWNTVRRLNPFTLTP